MGSTLHLNSNQLRSETEFHDEIERQLKPAVYGRNQGALWEVLTELVEPSISIITWINAGASKKFLGDRFKEYVRVFQDAQAEFLSGDYILVLKV